MMANNIRFAGSLFVPRLHPTGGPVVIFIACSYMLYFHVKSEEFQVWIKRFKSQQPQLYVIIFTKLEAIWCALSAAAHNARNINFVMDGKFTKLKEDERFAQAVRITYLFIQQTNDMMSTGSYFRDIPALTSDSVNPEKIRDKERAAEFAALIAASTSRHSAKQPTNTQITPSKDKRARLASVTPLPGTVVATETPKKDPTTQGFFIPKEGCTFKKLFGSIKEAFPDAELPCYDHHGVTLSCPHGDKCKFRHKGAVVFPQGWIPMILKDMLKHKCATLNPAMKRSRRFSQQVTEKYNSLWDSDSPDGMSDD
jgi:hypothetical protein